MIGIVRIVDQIVVSRRADFQGFVWAKGCGESVRKGCGFAVIGGSQPIALSGNHECVGAFQSAAKASSERRVLVPHCIVVASFPAGGAVPKINADGITMNRETGQVDASSCAAKPELRAK